MWGVKGEVSCECTDLLAGEGGHYFEYIGEVGVAIEHH